MYGREVNTFSHTKASKQNPKQIFDGDGLKSKVCTHGVFLKSYI